MFQEPPGQEAGAGAAAGEGGGTLQRIILFIELTYMYIYYLN